jgi:hypothetical protein
MFTLQTSFKPLFLKRGGGGGKIRLYRWLWIARRKTLQTFVPITSKNSASSQFSTGQDSSLSHGYEDTGGMIRRKSVHFKWGVTPLYTNHPKIILYNKNPISILKTAIGPFHVHFANARKAVEKTGKREFLMITPHYVEDDFYYSKLLCQFLHLCSSISHFTTSF